MLNLKPDFAHVIMEMCQDGLVIGSSKDREPSEDKISWPGWMVDQTLATYWGK